MLELLKAVLQTLGGFLSRDGALLAPVCGLNTAAIGTWRGRLSRLMLGGVTQGRGSQAVEESHPLGSGDVETTGMLSGSWVSGQLNP